MTDREGPGTRVLVTRAAEDARVLSFHLARVGFEPVEVPVLQRVWEIPSLVEACAQPYHILLLTSATAASVYAAACTQRPTDLVVGCVGPATARRSQELGLPVDITPEVFLGSELVSALGDLSGKVVLYPRSDLAPPSLAEQLREAGATVLDPVAYTNRAPSGYERQLLEALPIEATTLLSGSAATRLAEALPASQRHKLGYVVCIGPSADQVARQVGLSVDAVAEPHTINGMVECLKRRFIAPAP